MGTLTGILIMNTSSFILTLAFAVALVQGKAIIKGVQVCPGYEDSLFQFMGGNSPDEVPLPGNIVMDMHMKINGDMPADLVISLCLQKQDPFPLDVPCLNGLGSCEYDMCKIQIMMASAQQIGHQINHVDVLC